MIITNIARVEIPFLNFGKYCLSLLNYSYITQTESFLSSFTYQPPTYRLLGSSQKHLILELPLWSEGKGANSKVITTVFTL